MYAVSNNVLNLTQVPIWCVYSAPSPTGGWDIWRVRLLRPGYETAWKVDVDYVQARDPGKTINGRPGWWKLGQGGSFAIGTDRKNRENLVIVPTGGMVKSVRHFEDWARGNERSWFEQIPVVGKKVMGDSAIARQLAEWEALKDPASPIE